jgi:hypothetical protein
MKETEVRERVQAFLRDTVRLVVVPASMGIGLALIGCSDSADDTRQDAGADVVAMAGQSGQSGVGNGSASGGAGGSGASGGAGGVSGSGGAGSTSSSGGAGGSVTVYAAPVFDAGAGGTGGNLATLVPPYMAVMPDAAVNSGGTGGMKYSAPMSSGGRSSSGGSGGTPVYASPIYDAGAGGTGGLATIVPPYMAVLPDAAVSTGGVATKYAAPISSGGNASSSKAYGDAGSAFEEGSVDAQTGGTTSPVTRYGGIFPSSSSSS